VQVRPRVELPSIRYDLPQDFYLCYNCDGKGLSGEDLDKLCDVCQGRGEVNNDHKYIQRLKQLFGKHGGKSEAKEE
jgi:DnaJ-class molecular chaperone